MAKKAAVKKVTKTSKRGRGRPAHTPAQKKAKTAFLAKMTAKQVAAKKKTHRLHCEGTKWSWVKKTVKQKTADTKKSRKLKGKVNKGLKAAKKTTSKKKASKTKKANKAVARKPAKKAAAKKK